MDAIKVQRKRSFYNRLTWAYPLMNVNEGGSRREKPCYRIKKHFQKFWKQRVMSGGNNVVPPYDKMPYTLPSIRKLSDNGCQNVLEH